MVHLRKLLVLALAFAAISPAVAQPPSRHVPCDAQSAVLHQDASDEASLLVARRGKSTFREAVQEAIQSSDLNRVQKLRLRLAMAMRPAVKDAVEEHLLDVANEGGVSIASVDSQIDLDQFERLLQILIEYLPQLIEIFVGLFGSMDAPSPASISAVTVPTALCKCSGTDFLHSWHLAA